MIDDYENIPDIMRHASRWLFWKQIKNKDPSKKPKKVPFYINGSPRNGTLDNEDDIKNLATFETAFSYFDDAIYSGFGFALGPDGTGNHWQGVDFDGVAERPKLASMVEDLPGYTEMSPSGNGWHSIGYGRKFQPLGSNKSGVEAYSYGRYFTVTGECSGLSDPCCIADYVEKTLSPLHTLFAHKPEKTNQPKEEITPKTLATLRSALFFMRSDDRECWQRNGHRLKGLGETGRGLWFEWSSQSQLYDPPNDSKTWDSFHPTHTGYRAVFTEAQQIGWINPEKKIPEDPAEAFHNPLLPQWLSGDNLADGAKAPDFLINNILETNSHGLLCGSSQAFKTFCVIKIAHSICTGSEFFGNPVFTTGRVLYICGEGHGALARRIKALKIVEGDFNNNLFVLNQPLSIDEEKCMAWLQDSIDKYNPMLVIADTFSSLATGTDENNNSEVARTLRLISTACTNDKTCSIVVHHYGKDSARGSRGASSFGGNVDFEFNMERQGETMQTVLSCKKSKDSERFQDIGLLAEVVDLGLIRQDGGKSSSLVLKAIETLVLPQNQERALSAIRQCLAAEGFELDDRFVIAEKQVRKCLTEEFKGTSHIYKAFNEQLPRLIERNMVKTDGGNYWL